MNDAMTTMNRAMQAQIDRLVAGDPAYADVDPTRDEQRWAEDLVVTSRLGAPECSAGHDDRV
jgi:hypothetical protein